MTLYLVRHAKAGEREAWEGDDDLRPLSKGGHKQAAAIATLFDDLPVARVLSSPAVRCRQTVEPIAAQRRLPLEPAEELAEGTPLPDVLRLVEKTLWGDTILCTHGDVIADLLTHLDRAGVSLDEELRLEKGSTWLLDVRDGEIVSGRYIAPPR